MPFSLNILAFKRFFGIVLFLSAMPLFVFSQKQTASPSLVGVQQVIKKSNQSAIPALIYLLNNMLDNAANSRKTESLAKKKKADPESIYPDFATTSFELSHFAGVSYDSIVYLRWKADIGNNIEWLFIEKSSNRKDFYKVGEIDMKTKAETKNFDFIDNEILVKPVYYYQVKALTSDGSFLISDFIAVKNNINGLKVSVTPDKDEDVLRLHSNQSISKVEIIDNNGRIVARSIKPQLNETISLRDISSGVYGVRVYAESGSVSELFITKE